MKRQCPAGRRHVREGRRLHHGPPAGEAQRHRRRDLSGRWLREPRHWGRGVRIAAWLNKHGVTGVVLEYRLPKGQPHVPLLDAQRAIRTVRANGKAWGIDPAKVGIIGFSAGGHLASTAGTHFDEGDPEAADAVEKQSSRPDFMILV